MLYSDKLGILQDLFGMQDVALEGDTLRIGSKRYPILEDVIILCEPSEYTEHVRRRLHLPEPSAPSESISSATSVQFTFGEEWREYPHVLSEHKRQFTDYFDLIDLTELQQSRVCDLGCGNGRWSYFLKDRCKELVLVDFSDAIFVAQKNLSSSKRCLFFMCDLRRLPFRDDFCDFLVCLGVLHHLPTPCLDAVRGLRRYAPTLLIFLYYALDNRPAYFRWLLRLVTPVRLALSRLRSPTGRKMIAKVLMYSIYWPLIGVGRLAKPFGWSSYFPLYDSYHESSGRLEQDVFDRFFTPIEQRVTRNEILALRDSFSSLEFPGNYPYYHFLCRR